MTARRRPKILYLTSYPHQTFQIECAYNIFHELTKVPLRSYMNALLRHYHYTPKYSSYELKQMLNIRKHLPLIINDETVLLPIHQKRAPMQHFINGLEISGLRHAPNATQLIFKNGEHLLVKAQYAMIHRKWLECIFLHYMTFIAAD